MSQTGAKYGFYQSGGKRLLDIYLSIVGLVLLAPVLGLIAILIKLISPGPLFYRQERVGKGGHIFKIIKFRTMQIDADKHGPSITVLGDPRVTVIGRILRALKLDELPQLWNVLKGDMSLVGPRPEVPVYVRSYTDEQKKVLTVRPGITDPSSLVYRYEEELLSRQANPENYYKQVVLPHKLLLNAEYMGNVSLEYDLMLLAKTMYALLLRHSDMRPPFLTILVSARFRMEEAFSHANENSILTCTIFHH